MDETPIHQFDRNTMEAWWHWLLFHKDSYILPLNIWNIVSTRARCNLLSHFFEILLMKSKLIFQFYVDSVAHLSFKFTARLIHNISNRNNSTRLFRLIHTQKICPNLIDSFRIIKNQWINTFKYIIQLNNWIIGIQTYRLHAHV